jgi:DNA repair protein RecN (Recombination protein N)
MLQHLTIQNIVLIEKLHMEFDNGLCVLSGETGAGKSILIDALSLVLGARADFNLIRDGADQAAISGMFTDIPDLLWKNLADHGIEPEDNTLVIRRILQKDGKSKAFINDIPVGLTLLRLAGSQLVEIEGQFDGAPFSEGAYRRSLIDTFGHIDTATIQNLYAHWRTAVDRLESLKNDQASLLAKKDYLSFCLKEFEDLDPQPNEEQALMERRHVLMNKQKIDEAAYGVLDLLELGEATVQQQLSETLKILESANAHGLFAESLSGLERAYTEVAEVAHHLHQQKESISEEKESDLSLDQIEERLYNLARLARKHNVDIKELTIVYDKLAADYKLYTDHDQSLEAYEKEAEASFVSYTKEATALTKKRIKAAENFCANVLAELGPLKLGKTVFTIDFSDQDPTPFGTDVMDFMVSFNPGSAPIPLHKCASGGERSRFKLAVRVVTAAGDAVKTLVFDEIDSGMGGQTAAAVGERLRSMATEHQVITITHSPQVAATGQAHWFIAKEEDNNHMRTTLTRLTQNQRQTEIARMLSGEEITPEAQAAAHKLLDKVN